jgi:hypothetical protein
MARTGLAKHTVFLYSIRLCRSHSIVFDVSSNCLRCQFDASRALQILYLFFTERSPQCLPLLPGSSSSGVHSAARAGRLPAKAGSAPHAAYLYTIDGRTTMDDGKKASAGVSAE